MDQPKEEPIRRTHLIRDLLYLIACAIVFIGGSLVWKYFHPDSNQPAAQRTESLNDHYL